MFIDDIAISKAIHEIESELSTSTQTSSSLLSHPVVAILTGLALALLGAKVFGRI